MKFAARLLSVVILAAGSLLAQSGVIAPNENLLVDGIPDIPASVAETVARYTDFRVASLNSWHPTRREMLITTRFGDTNQIHLVKMPGGARTQLTFFPERVAGARYQPKTGEYFLFSKDIGGGEFFQTYRYDFSTAAVTLLTDGGRSQNSLGVWSNAGDRVAYASTRRNGKDRDIWVMDPRDPKSSRLVGEMQGGGWFAGEWSPDDKQLGVVEYISINESYLWLLDVASGGKKLVTPKGGPEKVSYGGAAFSKDGKGLYVTTDKGSEFQRLAYLDFATGRHTFLTSHINWGVDDFELSPDGKTIAFVVNEDGVDVLHFLDTATRKEKPAPKLPAGVLFGLNWHDNSRDFGFAMATARSTGDVYSVDISTGKLDRWTYSETGGLNTESFPEAELIRWKSFDDRTISGFLFRPPVRFAGKRPVIINIHGGPEGQARPTFIGRNNYYLNELGAAIIFPNVRGSSGYGKSFLQLDNGFLREHSYWDIGALLDWIKTRPELDADRIMVTGGSYGGFMTLAVATNYPHRIRCALDVVGPSNFVSFLENTEAYRRDLRRAEYGDERDPKMREFLERTAPLNKADKISKPLFIVQGANDPRVPRSESEQMVATLKKQGTPVWYLVAKDEGHGFAKRKNQDFQFYATVLFIQEHLLK
ncbi:MAG: S9 family peptidase [Candidatus Acidiferrales bacterium]